MISFQLFLLGRRDDVIETVGAGCPVSHRLSFRRGGESRLLEGGEAVAVL
jgi:hypothetical protein